MEATPITTDELTTARLPRTSPALTDWYSHTDLAAQLAKSFAPELERLDNMEFATGVRDAVGLDIPDPTLWANRKINHHDVAWSLIGIRFRNRDLDKPFVDVVASSVPPTVKSIQRITSDAAADLEAFSPRTVRILVADPVEVVDQLRSSGAFEQVEVDQYVSSGLITELNAVPQVPTFSEVVLTETTAAEAAAQVAEIYAGLESGMRWGTPASRDALQDTAEQDLLFHVTINGEPAGVVAALRENQHGMTGYQVHEICLDAKHRGRGYGPAVLQHLTQRLPVENPGDVLWGTVVQRNAASLRNTQRIGRQIIAGYL